MHRLREAIRQLPPEEQEVFLLRQNGQWSYQEIAQRRTRTVEVVKDQMRSALRKLRRVLEEMPLVAKSQPPGMRQSHVQHLGC
jgi:RNA polymerase sigma-70 factor (ECF subfamily)